MSEHEPLRDYERHATRDEDWRVYGRNLAAENYYMGAQFPDVRRIMLDVWEAYTSGDPDPDEVLHEMLATWFAMAMSCGIEGIDVPFEAFAAELAKLVP